jgi:MFS family permease
MRVFFAVQSCIAIASGIVLPFYILVLHEAGNTALSFAGLYALFTLTGAITYLLTDTLLKFFSYRALLVMSNLLSGLALLAITYISHVGHLAAIQIVLGAGFALQKNLEKIILAEHTSPQSRISDIGKYHTLTSLVLALSVIGTGWLIDTFSIKILFYGGGFLYLLAAAISSRMKI